MSDPLIKPNPMLTRLYDNNARLKQTETKETPPLWFPYAVNPLAAPAAVGDFAQPWPILSLVFYVSVFVATTNNATNFWTIDLIEQPSGTVVASVSTASGVTASTWTRLKDTSVTASPTTTAAYTVSANKTLAPGNLFMVPSVSVLRTGN